MSDQREGPINLRDERRRRGLSMQRAADEIGVHKRVLQEAERGSTPRPDNALKIATFFGVDVVTQWPEPDATEVAA